MEQRRQSLTKTVRDNFRLALSNLGGNADTYCVGIKPPADAPNHFFSGPTSTTWCSASDMHTVMRDLDDSDNKILHIQGVLREASRKIKDLEIEVKEFRDKCIAVKLEKETFRKEADTIKQRQHEQAEEIKDKVQQQERSSRMLATNHKKASELTQKLEDGQKQIQDREHEIKKLFEQIATEKEQMTKAQDKEIDMFKRIILKPTQFYDIVLRYFRFSDLIDEAKGWQLHINEKVLKEPGKMDSHDIHRFDGVPVSVVGDFNRGKTWILSKITGSDLPCGDVVTTPGICAKAVTVNKSRFIIMDTAGLNSPVHSVKDTALKEKKAEEAMLRDLSFRMCSTYVYVVDSITAKEQLEIFQLARDLYQDHKRSDKHLSGLVMVIHNLRLVDTEKKYQLQFDKLRSIYNAKPLAGVSDTGTPYVGKYGRIGSIVRFRPPGMVDSFRGVIEAMDETSVVVHILDQTLDWNGDVRWAPQGPDVCYIAREYWDTEADVEILLREGEEQNLVREVEFEVRVHVGEDQHGQPCYENQKGTYFTGNYATEGSGMQFFDLQRHFVLGKEGTPGGKLNDATIEFIRQEITHQKTMGKSINFIEHLKASFHSVLPRYFTCGGYERFRPAIKITPPVCRGGPYGVYAFSKAFDVESGSSKSPRVSKSAASEPYASDGDAPPLQMKLFELGTFTQIKSQNKTIPYGVFVGQKRRQDLSSEENYGPLQIWTIMFEVPGLKDSDVRISFENDTRPNNVKQQKLVLYAKKPKPQDLADLFEDFGTLCFEDVPAPIEVPIPFQVNADTLSRMRVPSIRNGVLTIVIEELDCSIPKLEAIPDELALQSKAYNLKKLRMLAKAHRLDDSQCNSREDFVTLLLKARESCPHE